MGLPGEENEFASLKKLSATLEPAGSMAHAARELCPRDPGSALALCEGDTGMGLYPGCSVPEGHRDLAKRMALSSLTDPLPHPKTTLRSRLDLAARLVSP